MTASFAELPALPLHTAGKYVAGAYIVFVLVILIYVAIMAVRLTRNQQEILKIKAELDEREAAAAGPAGPAASSAPPSAAVPDRESERVA